MIITYPTDQTDTTITNKRTLFFEKCKRNYDLTD